jgi:flavin-binding protein dodecin
MSESVYKVIELVGTSTDSWEAAAANAVNAAAKSPLLSREGEGVVQVRGRLSRAASSGTVPPREGGHVPAHAQRAPG